ncbi:MAG: phenylalanine--tRNA ligase subunit alpha [Candidatus Eremiobacteraeota bacterium]|nr:phenylalanine--tRNA ligase subunit alpha [Candidatus Eremiobacteraeota bacterium]
MDEKLRALVADARVRAAAAADATALETLRTEFLGRKGGKLSAVMAGLARMPAADRAQFGKDANEAKAAIEEALDGASARLDNAALAGTLERRYDVTLSAIPPRTGSLHPLRRTLEDIAAFFRMRGFAVIMGPEVETEFYAFEAMNIPKDHPAREGMDTFYLPPGTLLRPHTSPVQMRAMQTYPPPLAVIVPGKAYRRDALDASHSFMFHQVEGLHVDRGVTFAHLKGFAADLCRHLMGQDRSTRFRPSYFPFTEPSAEIDISCGVCNGVGCRVCKGSGWLEMGGCGMVHPNVLRLAGYDPEEYTGWAWGLGIERIAMLRHGIDDIRLFIENDPAFLEQFA